MSRFEGKVAIVTGAGSGLGRATAQRLAKEGALVACLDIDEDGAKQTDAGPAITCDVADPASVESAVARAVSELGRPSVVVNAAGIGRFARTEEAPVDDWLRIVGVNLTGCYLMARATVPHLLDGGGVIVNVASTAGLMGQPYSAAYVASKHGVVGLTKALAAEYLRRGVRVVAVAPGGMDTPMVAGWMLPEGIDYREIAHLGSPMGMSKPEEVAGTIAYVASDEARYMTGSVVVIDGGITI